MWAAIRYLVSLTEEEAALIRNHSGWILGADPEAGLQVGGPRTTSSDDLLGQRRSPPNRANSTVMPRVIPSVPPAQAFLQMQPPLSPALVLSILGDSSPDLSALYLEAALHMGLALPQVWVVGCGLTG